MKSSILSSSTQSIERNQANEHIEDGDVVGQAWWVWLFIDACVSADSSTSRCGPRREARESTGCSEEVVGAASAGGVYFLRRLYGD